MASRPSPRPLPPTAACWPGPAPSPWSNTGCWRPSLPNARTIAWWNCRLLPFLPRTSPSTPRAWRLKFPWPSSVGDLPVLAGREVDDPGERLALRDRHRRAAPFPRPLVGGDLPGVQREVAGPHVPARSPARCAEQRGEAGVRAGVAAVGDESQEGALRQGLAGGVDVVVEPELAMVEVDGHHHLVEAVLVVAREVLHLRPVPGVLEDELVARLRPLEQLAQCLVERRARRPAVLQLLDLEPFLRQRLGPVRRPARSRRAAAAGTCRCRRRQRGASASPCRRDRVKRSPRRRPAAWAPASSPLRSRRPGRRRTRGRAPLSPSAPPVSCRRRQQQQQHSARPARFRARARRDRPAPPPRANSSSVGNIRAPGMPASVVRPRIPRSTVLIVYGSLSK